MSHRLIVTKQREGMWYMRDKLDKTLVETRRLAASSSAMKICHMTLTLAMALSAGVATAAVKTYTGTVVKVIDGDTVSFRSEKGRKPQTLRLEGIDAPESCQMGGKEATRALERLVLKKRVQARVRETDMYGRGVARLYVKGDDVGARMVRAGQAWSYHWKNNPGPYDHEETLARTARRGVFESLRPEPPGQFRKRNGPCPVASYTESRFSRRSKAASSARASTLGPGEEVIAPRRKTSTHR